MNARTNESTGAGARKLPKGRSCYVWCCLLVTLAMLAVTGGCRDNLSLGETQEEILLVEITMGIDGVTWEQDGLEHIAEGGEGPTRIKIKHADGTVLADVRMENFKEAMAAVEKQMAQQTSAVQRGFMPYADFDSMSDEEKTRVIEDMNTRIDDIRARIGCRHGHCDLESTAV